VLRLDRLELRRDDNPLRRQTLSSMTTDLTGQTPFGLAMISSDNVDLCAIQYLTEGEVRWIARILLDRRPDWFRKSAGS
jgi:hypothetical protein